MALDGDEHNIRPESVIQQDGCYFLGFLYRVFGFGLGRRCPRVGIMFFPCYPCYVGLLSAGEGCVAVPPVGLSGSGRFKFLVDPARFGRLTWSSKFLHALNDTFFFCGAAICFAIASQIAAAGISWSALETSQPLLL